MPRVRPPLPPRPGSRPGLTLIELIVALSILGLFVSWTTVNLSGVLRRATFRGIAEEFTSTLRTAVTAAAESDRRYELVIDLPQQTYLLREITTLDLDEAIRDEDILLEGSFGTQCRVSYVQFDDLESTYEDRAKFRVGRAGWQYGGKIVLLDEADQPHTVLVHRLNRTVEVVEGDVAMAMPMDKESMLF